jgi:Cu-Zn family superoxide dismutase
MDSYKEKYFKYKSKYIDTKRQFVGLNGGLVDVVSEQLQPYSQTQTQPYQQTQRPINTDTIKAIAVFDSSNIKGTVLFEEIDSTNLVSIKINLSGFEHNSFHGFHVHETGDLSKGCNSLCAHFNPYNKSHGGREDEVRHVGDLGNIHADSLGNVSMEFTDHLIKLRGSEANIIGRGLIIHADQDDCGKGTNQTSKTTGNSGDRIACAIIGYASKCE